VNLSVDNFRYALSFSYHHTLKQRQCMQFPDIAYSGWLAREFVSLDHSCTSQYCHHFSGAIFQCSGVNAPECYNGLTKRINNTRIIKVFFTSVTQTGLQQIGRMAMLSFSFSLLWYFRHNVRRVKGVKTQVYKKYCCLCDAKRINNCI